MTNNLSEMTYDQLVEYSKDVMKEVRRRAYHEGYKQGRFEAQIESDYPRLSPEIGDKLKQDKRDRIIEQAKKDVEDLKYKDSDFYELGKYSCAADFIVNKEKRTVVALLRGYYSNIVRAKGIAKCAPGDCFNVWIGKAIALRRALGLEIPPEYLSAPQPTEVRVGDEIYDEHYQMSGKVYAINPEYRTYGEGAGYYFGKSKGWLTYIDPRNYERRIERKFVKVTDDSCEEVSE